MMRTELVVATRNKKKLKEIKYLLKGCNFKITSLSDYRRLPEIIEDGVTFKQNAIKKATIIAGVLKKLCLGEDSGLEVRALGNRPGVFSARYAGKNADDRENNKKLLRELEGIPRTKRQARYVCSVALVDARGIIGVVQATCSGLIAFQQRGSSGFGYDPLFLVPKYNKTFAELGERIKHTMSHRSKALQKARRLILARQKSNRQGSYAYPRLHRQSCQHSRQALW